MKTLTLAAAALTTVTLLAGCSDGDPGTDGAADRSNESSADGGGGEGGGGGGGGNDFTEQSGEEIAQTAKDAMAGLESVRVSGAITSDGQEISLDLAVSTAGECAGTISLGGASAELVGADGKAWFKPSNEFWQAQAGEQAQTIIDLVAGRWVVMSGDDAGFGEFCQLDSLLDELVSGEDDSTYEKGDVSDVEGSEAIAVTSTGDDGTSVGYVQVDGEHYLVKVEVTSGDEPGAITFSDFDAEVPAEAPPAEDTVDLDELGG